MSKRKPQRTKPPSQRISLIANDVTLDQLRCTARHEAGHAVAAVVLGISLEHVDIKVRRIGEDVSFGWTKTERLVVDSIAGKGEEAAWPHLITAFAGFLAETELDPKATEECDRSGDMQTVAKIISIALGAPIFGPDASEQNRERATSLVRSSAAAASELVTRYADAIDCITESLLRRRMLTGDEVASIVEANPPSE
jgi:hypothetical protein